MQGVRFVFTVYLPTKGEVMEAFLTAHCWRKMKHVSVCNATLQHHFVSKGSRRGREQGGEREGVKELVCACVYVCVLFRKGECGLRERVSAR